MAGRGTDIVLGGNVEAHLAQELRKLSGKNSKNLKSDIDIDELRKQIADQVAKDKEKVIAAGGLLVIGTERHESRRIDDQLRGRAGRQGDPGRTVFFLSLEDDLMKIFGSEKLGSLLTKLGLKENEAVTHPWVSKSLQKAQQRVESHNYEIRKNLLQFDDVMNQQRKVIYQQRKQIMQEPESLIEALENIVHKTNGALIESFYTKKILQRGVGY